jgi:hypothetical protein
MMLRAAASEISGGRVLGVGSAVWCDCKVATGLIEIGNRDRIFVILL